MQNILYTDEQSTLPILINKTVDLRVAKVRERTTDNPNTANNSLPFDV